MLAFILSLATFVVLATPAVLYVWRRPQGAHKTAFWKAFFLWLVSTSPVIAGILLSSPEKGKGTDTVVAQFQSKVLASFTLSEMFVYAAAFLAPVLYVVFDIVKNYNDGDLKLERKDLANHMRGMQGVFLSSICILILTLLAYSSEKSDPQGFPDTYLALFLTGRGFILYLASLVIWYSVILWETTPKTPFESAEKRGEAEFADEYTKRRGQKA